MVFWGLRTEGEALEICFQLCKCWCVLLRISLLHMFCFDRHLLIWYIKFWSTCIGCNTLVDIAMRSLEVTEAILVSAVVKLVEVLGTQFCHQKGSKDSSWEHLVLQSHSNRYLQLSKNLNKELWHIIDVVIKMIYQFLDVYLRQSPEMKQTRKSGNIQLGETNSTLVRLPN